MKNNILLLISSVIALIFGVIACQSPEDLTPSVSRNGINSITASFPDDDSDENSFSSEIDYTNHVITVVIPYNYPLTSDNVVQTSDLSNMRVVANLDDNVYLSPALLYMDLTKENYITITDQTKNEIEYKVVAEIRKSSECAITQYDIPSIGLTGIIDETNKTVSLISIGDIGSAVADITLSHGATISPDPSVESMNYDEEFTVTVTAQNGVDEAIYTVKKAIPEKVELGIREDSRKLLWAKKLVDLGLTTQNMTTGISAINNYLVINTRGENSLYLDAKTGAALGTIDISTIKGSLTNFYSTADAGNNILICNLTPNAGTAFKVWKIAGVGGSVEPFISFDTSLALGRKLSVVGSIDTNAIITAPIYAAGGQFARWQVVDGSLVSQTPDIVTATGASSWGINADVVYTDGSNLSSDYLLAYYGSPFQFAWYSGSTNTGKVYGSVISSNWIMNSVDYVLFNKAPYALHNSVNSFTWGTDDSIYMYDLNTNSLSTTIEVCETGIYGAKALGTQNSNATGDVAFKVSEDGYYLYVYFMFTNGYVVCVQYDCIDM
ncbi:MAG: hypothetical protein H6Q13_746 [Bacteroidetes bacterium]|nr:hypothetical protein [Bacteroidota bacterium]